MNKKYPFSKDCGFSLFEILVAIFILGIAIIPMVDAFKPALLSTAGEERLAVFTNQARSTLNRAVALDFATLNSNQGAPVDLVSLFGSGVEAAKETFFFESTLYTPVVWITDVSEGAGGLLEITVFIGNDEKTSLKTLKAEY